MARFTITRGVWAKLQNGTYSAIYNGRGDALRVFGTGQNAIFGFVRGGEIVHSLSVGATDHKRLDAHWQAFAHD